MEVGYVKQQSEQIEFCCFLSFILNFSHYHSRNRHQQIAESFGYNDNRFRFYKDRIICLRNISEIIKRKDLYSETDFQIEYLIDAKSVVIDGENKLLLSVTILQPLPEEIIEINKKEQSFYLATAKQNIPDTPEGNNIREFVSEEYINQARIVQKNYLNVIDRSEIEDYIQEIINEIKSK